MASVDRDDSTTSVARARSSTEKVYEYKITYEAQLHKQRGKYIKIELEDMLSAINRRAKREKWSDEQLINQRKNARKAFAAQDRKLQLEAHNEAIKCLTKQAETATIRGRIRIAEEIQHAQQAHAEKLKSINEELQLELINGKKLSAKKKQLLAEEIEANRDAIDEAEKAVIESKKAQATYSKQIADAEFARLSAVERLARREQDITDLKNKRKEIEDEIVDRELLVKLNPDDEENNKRLAELTESLKETSVALGSLENELPSLKSDADHEQAQKKLADTKNASVKDAVRAKVDNTLQQTADKQADRETHKAYLRSKEGMKAEAGKAKEEALQKTMENLTSKLADMSRAIDDNIDSFYAYQAEVEARLQGSQESFKDSLKNISKNVGFSGIVKQKDVIENIKKLAEAGVAYNLDLRAFLATVSDRIAQTFDVFDSNLMRLIRLQQSDTTTARLGMEASLNNLFNRYFSDTSYLKDAADSVSQAILDANSQLTRDMSIEFEYMVQKWLGALYSVGMDSNTISTIAQGLNYLGTGNVEALNSNESLQSLLAMSASKAGIPFADILTGGLDSETTNKLMMGMIEYLKSIAENTENNQVTKSAYSNVFGFSISDLTAASSLSKTDIQNLYKESIDYEGAMTEYLDQANQIYSRTHASQLLNTIYDNAMMSAATVIGNNSGLYATWKILNVIEDLTGGISIPSIMAAGFGVDLNTTVTGLAKTGIAGLSLMGSLMSSLFNGSVGGTMDYNKWGYDEFTSRGSAVKGISKGTAFGTSTSSTLNMVGSASSGDMKQTTLSDATDSAEEDSAITNKNQEVDKDIYAKIYEAIASDQTSVLEEVCAIRSLLEPSRIFYSALVGVVPTDINDKLQSSNSTLSYINDSTSAQQISKLSALSILNSQSDNNTSEDNKQLITTDGIKVSINQLTSKATSEISSTIRAAVVSALTGGTTLTGDSSEEGNTITLSKIIQDALAANDVGVKINNSGADEFFQKASFLN